MKLRSTTPALGSLTIKILVLIIVVSIAIIAPINMTKKVSADQYDDKISALQREIANYRAAAEELSAKENTLKTALDQLSAQKAAIQAQVDVSQIKYDQLIQQIAETEQKIKDNQNALGKTIADLYVDDKITPIEMIASSKNISEYLDKQEYRSSIRDELTSTISKIKNLKSLLVEKKSEVEKVLADQKSQRDQFAAKESEQQKLLNDTKGEESAYQGLIADRHGEIDRIKATQAALNARVNSGGGGTLINSGLLSEYPWNSSNCTMAGYFSTGGADGNGGDGHGYGCRQCTSYAAWKIAKETGIYYSWGNGGNFASAAVGSGYQNYGSNPTPNTGGYVAVMWGNPGHVAWIDSVSGDGSRVVVEQYNYNYGDGWGMYSKVDWPTSAFNQYVKIK